MRNVLFAFASLAAVSSIASADPLSVTGTTTSSDAAPTTYVQGGLMAGGNDHKLTAGGNVEIGKQVASIAWVHASFVLGSASELFATGSGSIIQGRVGGDLMTCSETGGLCAFVGADVGMQDVNYEGMSQPWFCGEDSDCSPNPISQHSAALLGVARVGLDLGGQHFRWRPGIEVSGTTDGGAGVNLTQSIAYRF
jgi:hypothetical protein